LLYNIYVKMVIKSRDIDNRNSHTSHDKSICDIEALHVEMSEMNKKLDILERHSRLYRKFRLIEMYHMTDQSLCDIARLFEN